jgi:hypothetical protein
MDAACYGKFGDKKTLFTEYYLRNLYSISAVGVPIIFLIYYSPIIFYL